MEEDKRLKLPANWEAKKARLEWELAEDQKKKVSVVSYLYVLLFCQNCKQTTVKLYGEADYTELYCHVTLNIDILVMKLKYYKRIANDRCSSLRRRCAFGI